MRLRAQQIAALCAGVARAGGAALGPLDDLFGGASLDPKWSVFEPTVAVYDVSGGDLNTTHADGAVGDGLWYNGFDGYLIYQNVTGDFDARATVRVSDLADTGALPLGAYRVAALQAHDPDRTAVRNYVSVGLGDVAQATLRQEWKSTVADVSDSGNIATGDFGHSAHAADTAELRLTRVGDVFTWYVDGIQIQQTTRVLPALLQLGICYYSNQGTADGSAHFSDFLVTQ